MEVGPDQLLVPTALTMSFYKKFDPSKGYNVVAFNTFSISKTDVTNISTK